MRKGAKGAAKTFEIELKRENEFGLPPDPPPTPRISHTGVKYSTPVLIRRDLSIVHVCSCQTHQTLTNWNNVETRHERHEISPWVKQTLLYEARTSTVHPHAAQTGSTALKRVFPFYFDEIYRAFSYICGIRSKTRNPCVHFRTVQKYTEDTYKLAHPNRARDELLNVRGCVSSFLYIAVPNPKPYWEHVNSNSKFHKK